MTKIWSKKEKLYAAAMSLGGFAFLSWLTSHYFKLLENFLVSLGMGINPACLIIWTIPAIPSFVVLWLGRDLLPKPDTVALHSKIGAILGALLSAVVLSDFCNWILSALASENVSELVQRKDLTGQLPTFFYADQVSSILFAPAIEEAVFRFCFLSLVLLPRRSNFWPLIISSLVFSVSHFSVYSLWALPSVAIIGVVLGMIYLKLGIVTSVFLHALFNIQSEPRVRHWLSSSIENASDFVVVLLIIIAFWALWSFIKIFRTKK